MREEPGSVAVFCMPGRGHFHRLRAVISGLSRQGARVRVFTDSEYRPDVEAAGGEFVDLFSRYPVEAADDESWPPPVRWVTYAARFAEPISREVAKDDVTLVVHDTFAVVAGVVAGILGVPNVNVCAGHALVPDRYVRLMENHPIVKVAPACLDAVEVLKRRYGMSSASPHSYGSAFSSYMNVYCEPPEFLEASDRPAFEPIEFYGSLPLDAAERRIEHGLFGDDASDRLKVLVSFGTFIWPHRTGEALAALGCLVDHFESAGDISAIITLGGFDLDESSRDLLTRPGVSIRTYVDQWSALAEADAFVTHNGLNSTHEAIYHRTPMVSYPFIADQPHQAETCQRMGLAIPLADEPMAPLAPAAVAKAMGRLREERERMSAALEVARGWELNVMAGREAVHQKILELQR